MLHIIIPVCVFIYEKKVTVMVNNSTNIKTNPPATSYLRSLNKKNPPHMLMLGLWYLMPLSTLFQLYRGGWNQSTQRKPQICHKSLTNFGIFKLFLSHNVVSSAPLLSRTYVDGSPGPGFEQAKKCGSVKPIIINPVYFTYLFLRCQFDDQG
jgi:hypothetical protein